MASKWVGELGMPKKGGDSYVSTVRGLDIGMELLKDVEKIGARETSIPRSAADEFEENEEFEPEWKESDWTPDQWTGWQQARVIQKCQMLMG